MVKTLNFHFNNVGSIPAGLISVFCAYVTTKKQTVPHDLRTNYVLYSLRFASIFAPSTIKKLQIVHALHAFV